MSRGPVLRDGLKSRWGGGGSKHAPLFKLRPHYKKNEWIGLTDPLKLPTLTPVLGFQYVYANRKYDAETTVINGKDMDDLFGEYVMAERMVERTIQYT